MLAASLPACRAVNAAATNPSDHAMQLISIQVGRPIELAYGERQVRSGIFKQAIEGAVTVERCNLAGDGQADLANHGGPHKAVYAYALEHYAYWRQALGRTALEYGAFGENLTIAGLDEAQLCIGDKLEIGSARFCISQPRVPCFKLGLRLEDPNMPRRFAQSLRTGFYLQVLREGRVQAGDAVVLGERGYRRLAVRTLFAAYLKPAAPTSARVLADALEIPELSPEWREQIAARLRRPGGAER
jgi:MOSC domain-containing protein YiiM